MRSLARSLFFSLLALAFVGTTAAYADSPSERAIAALKKIPNKPDTITVITIPLLVKAIQSKSAELEKEVGIKLRFIEKGVLTIHSDIMREKVAKLGSFDVISYIPMWTGDFAAAEVAHPLDAWVAKYDPDLEGYMGNSADHAKFAGKVYALMADGDAHTYIMRKDVIEHPGERAAFKAKYGRDPGCPNTWDEHQQLISFFHRKAGEKLMGEVLKEEFFGTVEARVRGRNYVNWMHRFLSKGKLYFDDKMNPLIDSPEGIKATEEFLAAYKHMDPAATGWDSAQLLPHYGGGRAFNTIHFAGTANFAESPKKAITRGKNVYCVMPGTVVDGRLIQRTNNAGAFAYGVNAFSKHREVAYLVGQWLASPRVGTQIIQHRASFFEPVRKVHFEQDGYRKEMEEHYSPLFVASHEKQILITAPLVSLPGSNEYHDQLDIRLHEVLLGRLTPAQAMKKAAEAWDEVTDDEDRDSQIKYWAEQKKLFPKVDTPSG